MRLDAKGESSMGQTPSLACAAALGSATVSITGGRGASSHFVAAPNGESSAISVLESSELLLLVENSRSDARLGLGLIWHLERCKGAGVPTSDFPATQCTLAVLVRAALLRRATGTRLEGKNTSIEGRAKLRT
jgi:hypothetical protein